MPPAQTQRLSLARGFIKDAEMMLFDEPTSALDPVVEVKVVRAIRRRLARGGRLRTGVIVAHPLTIPTPTIVLGTRKYLLL